MRKTGNILILSLVLIGVVSCSEETPLVPEKHSISIPAVQLSGAGTDRIGAVEISDGAGYCYIDGDRIATMVFKAQYWAAFDLTVFHAIAPTDSALNVLYFYSSADTLRTIWHESYTKPLDHERAFGTAVFNEQEISSTSELSCLEAVPVDDQLVTGLTISGSRLNWSSGSGTVEIEDRLYEIFPFQTVDCSDCGETPDRGWYEVHSVFRGPQGEMEFGILYLFTSIPGRVSLYYRIQICELQLGIPAFYAADWTLEFDSGGRERPLIRLAEEAKMRCSNVLRHQTTERPLKCKSP